MLDARKVLIPIDFSDYSKACMEECCELISAQRPVDFHFVFVWRSPTTAAGDRDPQAELTDELESYVEDFRHPAMRSTWTAVLSGHPATMICQHAAENDCDLIVMPTHGRTGLKHLLIGSTAEQVVRHAPCPVLTLRLELS